MKTRRTGKMLCLFCLAIPIVLTVVAAAQSETASVWDRVQQVDDPELGELIQAAMENRENPSKLESMKLVHRVTLSYAQIKLLDRQIEQVSEKIASASGPAEMRYELLLARAELEANLMQQLADLREVMGVLPKYPFDKDPLASVNAWMFLHIVDQGVCVFDACKPFSTYWGGWRFKSKGLLSEKEALDYVRQRAKDEDNLPMRIFIRHTPALADAAKDLRRRVITVMKEVNSHMKADVRLELLDWVGSGQAAFYLRDGVARTMHAAPVRRPDGDEKPLGSGVVDMKDLDQHITWRITFPGNLPVRFRIEHDKGSAKLAEQIADRVKAVATKLNVTELVDVAKVRVKPIPEATLLGRWQALGGGEVASLDVRAGGAGTVTMSNRRSPLAEAGAVLACPWLLTSMEIMIDPQKVVAHGHRYIFRGHLDGQGNLVLFRGMIYPQGSFHISHAQPTILSKVQ